MSDLISRKKVIDILEKEKSLRCGYDADKAIFSIEKGIRELPTDYDVDKVVEELEERKALHERLVEYENKNGTVTEKYQHIKAIDVLNDAIEIVKKGIRKDISE